MPSSKKRQHHHQHHQAATHTAPNTGSKKNERIVTAAIVFFAVIGLGIAFFAAGASIGWLLGGTITGAVAGYFFGKQIKKALLKG